jgi:amino-acid N-acetyltransferase
MGSPSWKRRSEMLIGISPRVDQGDDSGRQPSPWSARMPALTGQVAEPVRVVLRPARIADMHAVEPLIRTFAEHNLMLPKSVDQLARSFREFVVAVDEDDRPIGCGALRVYSEDLAEICSLAVDRPYQGFGVGRRLVEHLIADARACGIRTVFALTLSPDFFGRLGFGNVSKADFPAKVWADCRSCPKLHACDEIAVAVDLRPSRP